MKSASIRKKKRRRENEEGLAVINTLPEESARIEGYMERIVPFYSSVDFKCYFRMTRTTFEDLCNEVIPFLNRERTLSAEKKLLSTLWILVNQECYRSVADRFGMSKGTLHLTVMKVCNVLTRLLDKYINFPVNRYQFDNIAAGFHQICGMPGVVGAIDGTHIPVSAPNSIHRGSYINRKGWSSTILQVICDSDLKFLDVYAGWPGSVHDARGFRNTPIATVIEDLPDQYHLLGDSAYPLSKSVVVPFRDDGHLDNIKKKFNYCHSSTRVDVERAIGMLKSKFRRLKYLDMLLEVEIPVVIVSCSILHNFILNRESIEDIIPIEPEENDLVCDGGRSTVRVVLRRGRAIADSLA